MPALAHRFARPTTWMQDKTMTDLDKVRQQLHELQLEHRDLDAVIEQLIAEPPFDQLQLQRLKKRKLALRDQIQKLEDILLPDIIA